MHIAIVYNARPTGYNRGDPNLEQYIEGDEWKTIQAVGQAAESIGHSVVYLKVDLNLYSKLKKLKGRVDLIFNLAEGLPHAADREAHLPMLAEILGIPYTGPGPLSSALILNKHRAKQIWHASKLKTAASSLISIPSRTLTSTSDSLFMSHDYSYPLIVKPNTDGSGIGIHSTSIVHNLKELQSCVKHIHSHYHQDALVETYLPGREFTVAIVGNPPNLTVLPIIEINFAGLPKGTPAIDSYEAKFVYGATGAVPMHETEICPAPISKKLKNAITKLACNAYAAIGCADFGRLDIRLDAKGVPHLLEINHPPGLMSDPEESSFFTIAARAHGWDFPTLIAQILDSATTRLAQMK